MWTELDNVVQKYPLKFKLGHVNANSIEGFKFYEIRTWLLSGRFDFLVISIRRLRLMEVFRIINFKSKAFACVAATGRLVVGDL